VYSLVVFQLDDMGNKKLIGSFHGLGSLLTSLSGPFGQELFQVKVVGPNDFDVLDANNNHYQFRMIPVDTILKDV
jgi:hypothetical protein